MPRGADVRWTGRYVDDFDKFWRVNAKLTATPPHAMKHAPIKLYRPGEATHPWALLQAPFPLLDDHGTQADRATTRRPTADASFVSWCDV